MANLSEEKEWEPVPQWAFIGFNLHRNTGHIRKSQSLSGSKDQTIGNIQRTMRAYSESGSDGQRAIKLWEQTHFMLGALSFKLRVFLAKQVLQDFMHSFFINPGTHPFLHRAALPFSIVSGLSQVGEVRQPRD